MSPVKEQTTNADATPFAVGRVEDGQALHENSPPPIYITHPVDPRQILPLALLHSQVHNLLLALELNPESAS